MYDSGSEIVCHLSVERFVLLKHPPSVNPNRTGDQFESPLWVFFNNFFYAHNTTVKYNIFLLYNFFKSCFFEI